jgi:hypothetical protein
LRRLLSFSVDVHVPCAMVKTSSSIQLDSGATVALMLRWGFRYVWTV